METNLRCTDCGRTAEVLDSSQMFGMTVSLEGDDTESMWVTRNGESRCWNCAHEETN